MRRNLLPLTNQPIAERTAGDPFTSLQREINRMFDDVWRDFGAPSNVSEPVIAPRIDYSEDDSNLYVNAELPGLTEDDVDVSYDDGMLKITGEKSQTREDTERNVHVTERVYGRFHRELPIGRDVKTDRIDASFKDGVLTVTLPKAAEAENTRKIAVKRAA